MTQVYTCSWTKAGHSLKYSSFVMLLEAPPPPPPGMADEAILRSWNRIGLYPTSLLQGSTVPDLPTLPLLA